MGDFEFDPNEIGEAFNFVITNTKKALPKVVNKSALQTIIGGKGYQGAMQLTAKAKKAAIRALNPIMVIRLVEKRLKAAGKKATREQIEQYAKAEINQRLKAVGYTAYVGWNLGARAFGGTGIKGMDDERFDKSMAQYGKGTRASSYSINPTAEFTNTSPAGEIIGLIPLEKAITNVARDLVEHTIEEMQKINDKVNG